jgi:hypothetical protein
MSWSSMSRGDGRTERWRVDLMGRRQAIGTFVPGAPSPALELVQQYDVAGNVSSQDEAAPYSRHRDFGGYDALNRLTSASYAAGALPAFSEAYSYDSVGNRLDKTQNAKLFQCSSPSRAPQRPRITGCWKLPEMRTRLPDAVNSTSPTFGTI